jgi:phosphoglycolate phosphatase-like HAD superfamily hydrolase
VSYYHEIGMPMNHKSVLDRDRALVATARTLFPSWDEILKAVGLDPEEIRLTKPDSVLSPEQVLLLAVVEKRVILAA